jgi:hypothetical protein
MNTRGLDIKATLKLVADAGICVPKRTDCMAIHARVARLHNESPGRHNGTGGNGPVVQSRGGARSDSWMGAVTPLSRCSSARPGEAPRE